MKIKFDGTKYVLYKSGKAIDTDNSCAELARKYKMRCVYFDGTWTYLSR